MRGPLSTRVRRRPQPEPPGESHGSRFLLQDVGNSHRRQGLARVLGGRATTKDSEREGGRGGRRSIAGGAKILLARQWCAESVGFRCFSSWPPSTGAWDIARRLERFACHCRDIEPRKIHPSLAQKTKQACSVTIPTLYTPQRHGTTPFVRTPPTPTCVASKAWDHGRSAAFFVEQGASESHLKGVRYLNPGKLPCSADTCNCCLWQTLGYRGSGEEKNNADEGFAFHLVVAFEGAVFRLPAAETKRQRRKAERDEPGHEF